MFTGSSGSFIFLYLITDRPIIRETKQLRVSMDDFEVKTQIGSGYFGEVHVSSINY